MKTRCAPAASPTRQGTTVPALSRRAARQRRAADPGLNDPASAANRASHRYPILVPRLPDVLALHEGDETTTGATAAALDYDRPDVHLGPAAPPLLSFAEKKTSAYPRTYRRGKPLPDESSA